MNDGAGATASRAIDWKNVLRALLVLGVLALWVSMVWVKPPFHSRLWKIPYKEVNHLLHLGFDQKGVWHWMIRGCFATGVPLVLVSLFRPPWTIGLGRPRIEGWKLVLLGWLVSTPLLIILGTRTGMQQYYHGLLKHHGWYKLPAYLVSIGVEHMFIQGLVLGLALPAINGQRPRDFYTDRTADPPRRGILSWFGLGLPWGEQGLSAWLGVPKAAWPALLAAALIFAQIHVGKDKGELLTSIPGGLALAIITLRARSVWPGVVLHLGTALIILISMVVFAA